ncbi:MAG: cobalamin-independent methionine synthase II family protein [Pseudomonadota bacterium]
MIKTTCIGAYPKPEYTPVIDWFDYQGGMVSEGGEVTRRYTESMANADDEIEALLVRATQEAIEDQVSCGVDIPTDGEQRRENYIHYHCRHLTGVDFVNLTKRVLRDGAYEAELPTINGRIEPRGDHFLDSDFRIAQSFCEQPVKITVPGPVTIMDTTANVHYDSMRDLAFDLADAINYEVRALADAGCQYIQVDEPLFARNVERAMDFGVECLDRCFDGVPDHVTRVMHMCCGYPDKLDSVDYHKADRKCYFDLAAAVDKSSVDQISIEDAHRYNDLSLLELFKQSTVIFGAMAIAKSGVESVDGISSRLKAALDYIDRDRFVVAPDCGLGFLGRDLAMTKLRNMCEAARSV